MKTVTFLFSALLCASIFAQERVTSLDPAELLMKHYGGKATGSPPRVTWTPQGEEAGRLGYPPDRQVVTIIDTVLQKGEDLTLFFFRTTQPFEGRIGEPCEACTDHLGVAVYAYNPAPGEDIGYSLEASRKWLLAQGINSTVNKPRLLDAIDGTPILIIASNDGDMSENSSTVRWYTIPDLKPVLEVKTLEFTETRGGPHGPVMTMTTREMNVVRDEKNYKEFPDVEVVTHLEEGDAGTTERFEWNDAQKTYLSAKTVTSPAPKPKTRPAIKAGPVKMLPKRPAVPKAKP